MEGTNQSQDDFIASLGNILGVSELKRNHADEKMVGSPVLVAENALVFLAWDNATDGQAQK